MNHSHSFYHIIQSKIGKIKYSATILACMILAAVHSGCSRNIPPQEAIIGTYKLSSKTVTEHLTINTDGTFLQVIEPSIPGVSATEITGTWKTRDGFKSLRFDGIKDPDPRKKDFDRSEALYDIQFLSNGYPWLLVNEDYDLFFKKLR